MGYKRRGFLKVVTTGLALGCADFDGVLARPTEGTPDSELLAGSGTVHLEGKLKSGTITLNAQDFLDRADRSVVVHGRLVSSGSDSALYSAMFSYQNDLSVFALFEDGGHSTTIVLSDTDEAKIGRLVVWNDHGAPLVYSIDKSKIMAIQDPKDIRDINGKIPDLVGNRKPPGFTWQELENIFGSDPALLAFMRGRKTTHHPQPSTAEREWSCRFLSMVPGSTLSLFWLGGGGGQP